MVALRIVHSAIGGWRVLKLRVAVCLGMGIRTDAYGVGCRGCFGSVSPIQQPQLEWRFELVVGRSGAVTSTVLQRKGSSRGGHAAASMRLKPCSAACGQLRDRIAAGRLVSLAAHGHTQTSHTHGRTVPHSAAGIVSARLQAAVALLSAWTNTHGEGHSVASSLADEEPADATTTITAYCETGWPVPTISLIKACAAIRTCARQGALLPAAAPSRKSAAL